MSTLYWITVLGNLKELGIILTVILLIVSVGAELFGVIYCQDDENAIANKYDRCSTPDNLRIIHTKIIDK